ncbi:MAG: heme-binding protein [Phycisphaerales bacterium JB060]
MTRSSPHCTAAILLSSLAAFACVAHTQEGDGLAPASAPAAQADANLPAQQTPARPIRVSGEPEFTLQTRTATLDDGSTGDMFIAGPMRINSPLPVGYPRPTPAGAMEVKHYPSIRRAQLTVEASPRWGMNMAFFPLFRHIKDRDIAMTAPVEAEVPAMAREEVETGEPQGGARDQTGEMTVSFLYRTSDMGVAGQAEEDVVVTDTKPVIVLALGIRGTMGNDRIEREIGKLYDWLDAQGDTNTGPKGEQAQGAWIADGSPRILGYNGPSVRRADQWWEVQVPIVWEAMEGTNNEAASS